MRIETIFIHMSDCRIFLSRRKMKKIVICIILIIMVLLCLSRFPHLAKVPTPCFYMSQGSDTLPRFLHLASYESRFPHLVKVSTPCFYVSQGFHTLFLCESRFPHLAKVPTPCFYVSQGFHTLRRFPHLVSM